MTGSEVFDFRGLGPGFWLENESFSACELAIHAGYQLIILDLEHGAISATSADTIVPFCNGLGARVFIRVASGDRIPIQQALDTGCDGIIIPQVEDLEDARRAVTFSKYPPLGTRGLGYGRTTGFGSAHGDFVELENKRVQTIVQIETDTALNDVDAIARMECVDALFLGPADLSLTSGRGLFSGTNEDFLDAKRFAEAAKANGKPWGMPAMGIAGMQFAKKHDADFITICDDRSAIVIGGGAQLKQAKESFGR